MYDKKEKTMKKITSTTMKMTVVICAIFSLIVAANAGYVTTTQHNVKKTPQINASTVFYANITFHVYEGEGCGCVPLRGVPLNATGRDTDHYTSGVTDDEGNCILQLEFDKTYRVSVQEKDHESVLFDFMVIDDQTFSFHLKVIEESSHGLSLIQTMLHKIEFVKRLIK
jgi:hypothetical protein